VWVVLAVLAAALGLGSVVLSDVGGSGADVDVDEVLGSEGLSATPMLRIVAGVVRDDRS
jgi:hypothetical protein